MNKFCYTCFWKHFCTSKKKKPQNHWLSELEGRLIQPSIWCLKFFAKSNNNNNNLKRMGIKKWVWLRDSFKQDLKNLVWKLLKYNYTGRWQCFYLLFTFDLLPIFGRVRHAFVKMFMVSWLDVKGLVWSCLVIQRFFFL